MLTICGSKITQEILINEDQQTVGVCPKCGQPRLKGDLFCAGCGAGIKTISLEKNTPIEKPEELNREIAAEIDEAAPLNTSPALNNNPNASSVGVSSPLNSFNNTVHSPMKQETDLSSQKQQPVNSSENISKKKRKKIMILLASLIGIFVIIIGIHFIREEIAIQEGADEISIVMIQKSTFSFLPEIQVGELLKASYGEGKWKHNRKEGCVEFRGTNTDDQSELYIQFQLYSNGTVNAKESSYSAKGITLSMDSEEFEDHIVSLYNNLSLLNIEKIESKPIVSSISTNKATTTITTTKKVTTTTTTTTTATAPPKQSVDYSLYLKVLSEGSSYALYDINQDGIMELLLYTGDGSVSSVYCIYSIISNELENIGEINGFSTCLSEKDGKLYSNFGHSGYQIINRINYDGYLITVENVSEGDVGDSYTIYGKDIPEYDTSDTAPITSLGGRNTEQTSENLPTISANVKVYNYASFSGSECRLYVSGDYYKIELIWGFDIGDGMEWETDSQIYHKQSIDDYIDLHFNVYAEPPAAIRLTPYAADGTKGKSIVLDIPREASGTI